MYHVKRSPVDLESSRKKKICLHVGDVQKTVDEEMPLQKNSEDAGQWNLSLLPCEILLKIFKLLSPADLVSLVELNDKRLTQVTYSVREANFSACRTADPSFVSTFFSRERVPHIQKLNFNYYFYLKPPELTSFICRCKNLKSLSVVGCELNFSQIYRILQSCRALEELAWTTTSIPEQEFDRFSNLKKLYLFREYMSDQSMKSPFLKAFPGLEQVWVDFDFDCNNSAVPFIGMWSMISSISNKKKSKHLMIKAMRGMYMNFSWISSLFRSACEKIIQQLFKRRKLKDLYDHDSPMDRTVSIPPFLQIRSDNEEILSVSSGPSKAFSTLVIHVTENFPNVSESLIKFIQEVAGDKLQHLSFLVHRNWKRFDDNLMSRIFISPAQVECMSFCDKIPEALEQISLTSKYITFLNLTAIHFYTNSPVRAITQLQNLKVLNLPSCALRSFIKENGSENLSCVVSACDRVEEFVLYCCVKSSSCFRSDDLVCIQNWSRLKHLSIIHSSALRSFAFLQRVADSCIQLSSLQIVALMSVDKNLFQNNVIYLLKKAKNLRFLRINDFHFNPMSEGFWPAIGEAVGLEGICITTKSPVRVSTSVVINEIKKLKHLHLFHFEANVPQCCLTEVKKSMKEHGIQNITCKEKCVFPFCVVTSLYSPLQMFHQRPYLFECSRLHLKDINLF